MATYWNPEQERLLFEESERLRSLRGPAPSVNRRAAIAAASLALCALGLFAVTVTSAAKRSPLAALDASAAVTLDVTNEYGPLASRALYGYKHLAEPHRESTLTAACAACATGTTYTWAVSHVEESDGSEVADFADTGADLLSVVVTFTKAPQVYRVAITATAADGSATTVVEAVTCKYVRREVRQLTTKDRER